VRIRDMSNIGRIKMNKLKAEYFDEFTQKMRERMEAGDKKYGNDWFFTNLPDEMEAELLDLANYAYLLYNKVKRFKDEVKKI
jgi:hypothetical protein